MRKERKYHYIYKITCKVTNRYYIGMHSTDNMNDGYFGSGKRLWYSIRKYGKENHIKEILEFFETREALKECEAKLVDENTLKDELCMNLTVGGQNGCGDYNVEKLKQFVIAGVKARIDKFNNDSNYRADVIKTASENLKKAWSEGKLKNSKRFTGLTHNEESKQLMSVKKQGTGIGETNSQYGTCWITKDKIHKKIKKEDLEKWVGEGWIKGRIY